MALTTQKSQNTMVSSQTQSTTQKLPILLFDIMDTVVRDPFYHDVPAFFRMSFEELIESKHPTAWFEFEKGMTDEVELARTFFKDGRPLKLEGLKNCLREGYSYVEGIEEMLRVLNITTMRCMLSQTIPSGKRKPDPEYYLEALKHLKVDPASCIFVDDRMRNVEAAKEVGITGIHFKNAELLRQDLSLMGISIAANQTKLAQE